MRVLRQLDRSRTYAIVYGDPQVRFEQDNLQFDARGLEVPVVSTPPAPSVSVPTAKTSPSPAAERMRRTRERRRAGVVAIIPVAVTEQNLATLVARTLVRQADVGDRQALSAAVRRALNEWAGIEPLDAGAGT